MPGVGRYGYGLIIVDEGLYLPLPVDSDQVLRPDAPCKVVFLIDVQYSFESVSDDDFDFLWGELSLFFQVGGEPGLILLLDEEGLLVFGEDLVEVDYIFFVLEVGERFLVEGELLWES